MARQEGGRYGAILFESQPLKSRPKKGGSAEINVRLACLVLARVKGTERPAARIRDFQVRRKGGGGAAIVAVLNEGNVLIRPAGELRLLEAGSAVLSRDLNPARLAILPGETREYQVAWSDERPPGRQEAVAELDFGGAQVLGASSWLE